MLKDYINRRETGHIVEKIKKLYKKRFEGDNKNGN